MEQSSLERPNIYSYLDYRQFLTDLLVYKKVVEKVSLRKVGKDAGFKSPNYLQLLQTEQRRLTLESGERLAQALGLRVDETRFFQHLIKLANEETMERKEKLMQQALRHRRYRELHPLGETEYQFYSTWKIPAVYESLDFIRLPQDADKLCERLDLTKTELEEYLEVLLQLRLVVKTSKGYRKANRSVETLEDAKSLGIRRFHVDVLRRGIESLEKRSTEKRNVQALTLPLSSEDFILVKKELARFLKNLNEKYSGRGDANNVYHLGVLLFPLMDEGEDAKEKAEQEEEI